MQYCVCSQCGAYRSQILFSHHEWNLGDGIARCKACVSGHETYVCRLCQRGFPHPDDLSAHESWAHCRRTPVCSFCGLKYVVQAGDRDHTPARCCSTLHSSTIFEKHPKISATVISNRIYRYASRQFESSFRNGTTKDICPHEDSKEELPMISHQCSNCAEMLYYCNQLLMIHQQAKHLEAGSKQHGADMNRTP